MFSSILTRDSDPSFKLVSSAGRVFTSIAKISEKFKENALRIYDFSADLSKFPEDLRPATYFKCSGQGGVMNLVVCLSGRSWPS